MFRRTPHMKTPALQEEARRRLQVFALLLAILALTGAIVFPLLAGLERRGIDANVLPAVLNWLVNREREQAAQGALTPSALLGEAAQRKAEDMAARGYFAHVDPEGREPWYWLDSVGYKFDYAGENLAASFTDAREVAAAWMESTSHRSNVLKAAYTEVGTGVATGTRDGREVEYVVQFYARPVGSYY